MSELSWITGLMKHNYQAVGFIPFEGVKRYLDSGRYILQTDDRGNKVGYILHSVPTSGGVMSVAQHLIESDKRLHGYGRTAYEELLDRARLANCRAIKVRCAIDLPSNSFWTEMGLRLIDVKQPATPRSRAINVLWFDLWPTLFDKVSP